MGKRILVIDDEEGMCRMIEAVLGDRGYVVETFTRPKAAMAAYVPGKYDLVVTDVKMPEMDGLEVLSRVRSAEPTPPVIMATAYATVDLSIQALRKGAYDMLTKPFEPEELIHRVVNALREGELSRENRELREELQGRDATSSLIGASAALRAAMDFARKMAARDFPILVWGESGTGKELVASAIHGLSPRKDRPFVALNCGALPQSLLESELFGSRKGAFTGADAERAGLLKSADGGTLFLDEVGNLPENVQKVLLRFLQEKEFYRVGDTTPTRVDVRIVSATNANLEDAVKAGTFREDLYYRLAAAKIRLPPLRERREDIPLLVAHFVREQNQRFSTDIRGFTPEAMQAMRDFDWPGNVRQLRNVVEAVMAVEGGEHVGLETLAQFIPVDLPSGACVADGEEGEGDYAASLSRFEASYFSVLLERQGGNVEEAARLAGINAATFYRKIKKYQLKK